jgi:hypothetical protein
MKPLAALGFEPAYARLDASQAGFDKYYGRMAGGSLLKVTRPGRFAELDALLIAELDRRFAPDRTIRVHDMAASSAITSLDLHEALKARRPVTVLASDHYDAVHVLEGGAVGFVFDADFAPLQLAIGSAGISAQHGLLRRALAPLWKSAVRRRHEARRVSLFHPRAEALAAADPDFVLARESFFSPPPGPYEVVRLLNAMWPSLGRDGTTSALRSVLATLTEDGLLVLGRAGNYTLFARREDGMEVLGGLGDAAENRDLVGGATKLLG